MAAGAGVGSMALLDKLPFGLGDKLKDWKKLLGDKLGPYLEKIPYYKVLVSLSLSERVTVSVFVCVCVCISVELFLLS